jgi:hypothetical protein
VDRRLFYLIRTHRFGPRQKAQGPTGQTLHRPRRVAAPRDAFVQYAPYALQSAHNRFLIVTKQARTSPAGASIPIRRAETETRSKSSSCHVTKRKRLPTEAPLFAEPSESLATPSRGGPTRRNGATFGASDLTGAGLAVCSGLSEPSPRTSNRNLSGRASLLRSNQRLPGRAFSSVS